VCSAVKPDHQPQAEVKKQQNKKTPGSISIDNVYKYRYSVEHTGSLSVILHVPGTETQLGGVCGAFR
jgi:hypothetical protein